MKQLKIIPILLVIIILIACSPSQSAVETAIFQTQAAEATSTPTETPFPTKTLTPTYTPTPSPTATPTPSPTPDLQTLQGDPLDFLMVKADLPQDAHYYLPNEYWMGMLHNEQIVGVWTVEKGKAYLAATGRIDGMWVDYDRGSTTVIAPQEIYDNVVIYQKTEGAQFTLTDYNTEIDAGYTELDNPPQIGDLTRAFTRKEMQSTGEYRVWMGISFTYRNIYHYVEGWGWENEVKLVYIEKVAQTILDRMKTIPLSSP